MPPRRKTLVEQRLSRVPTGAWEEEAEAEAQAMPMADMVAAGFRDPRVTLPTWGHVTDQKTLEVMRYDPDRLAPECHNAMLHWAGEAPRTPSGQRMWYLELGSRKTGKSTIGSLIVDNMTAYREGTNGIVMAHTKELAEELFGAIMKNHDMRQAEIKPDTIPNRESRQITYDHGAVKSKVKVLSADSPNVGIGRQANAMQLSEAPFYPDFAGMWSGLRPAFINVDEAVILIESTPAPMSEPSAETFKQLCSNARLVKSSGESRFLYHFTPFYASRLTQRPWNPNWALDSTEQRLLERFGPKGGQPESAPGEVRYLTREHLAFRRETMRPTDGDEIIRRWPEMFFVWYPVDDLTCWTVIGGGVIPSDVMDIHKARLLVPWMPTEENGCMQIYREPRPGAVYILAADPAGHGQDHAVFHIFEVWTDQIIQCATFASPGMTAKPHLFGDAILKWARVYNDAHIVVERNGAGEGALAILEKAADRGELQNLFYETRGANASPGVHSGASKKEEALGLLIDCLRQNVILYDRETVDQLCSYRHDKLLEESSTKQLVNPDQLGKGRRPKHHWDRASAMLWMAWGLRAVPMKQRPAWIDGAEVQWKPEATGPVRPYSVQQAQEYLAVRDLPAITYDEAEAYRKTLLSGKRQRAARDHVAEQRRVNRKAMRRDTGRKHRR